MVEFRHCRIGEEKTWDTYVYRCPQSSHCHLAGWRRVIERSYGHPSFYLWARENDETKGILPLIQMGGFLFSRSFVSMPFLDDGGICADDDHIRAVLYKQAMQLCGQYKGDILDLRHRQVNSLNLALSGSKATLILELDNDPDRMWKEFDAKVRNQVRKAQKSGLTASWGGIEGLPDFYEIFAVNMRDLGSPVHSRKFFTVIFEEFSDSAKLMLVRKGNTIIGGAVCFLFRETMLVPWASSQREYFPLCPNNLLYWEMIQWGCKNGYQRFDFGRSSPGSGTYNFKKQWGAKEELLHWQCLSRKNCRSSVVHADDPKYQWMIRTWQSLPISVTKLIGPLVRGQISS
jgi:FemAB-related protein (PEP-CTERM system-associated)